ncbi:hypothetical protein BTV99_12780, partial [Psychrobacter sp. Rd 27.2]
QLIEYLEDINQAVFKNLFDQRNEVLCVHDFKNVSSNNDVSVKVDIDEISDEDWKKAQQKYLAIKPLIGGAYDDYSGDTGLERRASEVNVSSRTLRRWKDAYLATNSVVSLLDKKGGWRKGESRLSTQMEKL